MLGTVGWGIGVPGVRPETGAPGVPIDGTDGWGIGVPGVRPETGPPGVPILGTVCGGGDWADAGDAASITLVPTTIHIVRIGPSLVFIVEPRSKASHLPRELQEPTERGHARIQRIAGRLDT